MIITEVRTSSALTGTSPSSDCSQAYTSKADPQADSNFTDVVVNKFNFDVIHCRFPFYVTYLTNYTLGLL